MSNDKVDCTDTPVPQGVDGAVGVPEPYWYVAVVSPRHEKKVAETLTRQNITAYVASQKEMHLWRNGRRRLVDRVVIPSVVFVKCTESERLKIVALPFVKRFLVNRAIETGGLNKPAARIPDDQIEKLKFMLGQSELPVTFSPESYRVNDNVRVIRGQLKGLQGRIMANSDGTHTLTVDIELLGGATVKIDPTDVEKIA